MQTTIFSFVFSENTAVGLQTEHLQIGPRFFVLSAYQYSSMFLLGSVEKA